MMREKKCENLLCKKVTERNRRYIVTHSGSSIYFCSIKCLVAFYSLEKEELETIHEVLESVIDMFSPDQVKDYSNVVSVFKKIGQLIADR